MQEIKKQVEYILSSYNKMQGELQVLEFELNRITPALRPEIIEGEVLARPGFEVASGSHISDKTADIVVEHVDGQRGGQYHAISTLIHNLNSELQRLEYYLSMLPENEADVIRRFYFERMALVDIVKGADCSLSTLKLRKKHGLDKLIRYYSVLDRLDGENPDMRTRVRFISYVHDERFNHCLDLAGKNRNPGIEAMLYILSGCNELWQAGVEIFFDFAEGTTIRYTESKSTLSGNGQKLLRLAYHLANGSDQDDLLHVLHYYFGGLEYVHLELAIEAVRMAFYPGTV